MSDRAGKRDMADLDTLPPGPERRALLQEFGMNISPADFSEAEWSARQTDWERILGQVRASTSSPA